MRKSDSKPNLNMSDDVIPFHKIVLTGGPCGGKTTALARLSGYLRERGFAVMTCPEAYSLLVMNGMVRNEGVDMGMCIQHSVMDLMISIEDSFERVLRARGQPAVLLCDRGIMDGSAYLSKKEWEQFLSSRDKDLTNVELREGRYDAVYHLVTAAEGAESFYTTENNLARTETPEEAKYVDSLTRNAWLGHPNFRVFDNSVDFETKMQRLVQATARLVGLPSEVNRESTKFILKQEPSFSDFPSDVQYHVFDVEKVFLHVKTPNSKYETEYSYMRRRAMRNSEAASYGHTTVQRTKDGQKIEVKRIITAREYYGMLQFKDSKREIIKQTRISFVWEMQSFNIHSYKEPVKGICILHCQSDPFEQIRLPPFIDVERILDTNCENDARRFRSLTIAQSNTLTKF